MIIEIEALDTLVFQDGKPFEKSNDSWGSSLVLPTPSTLYGALRATYFAKHFDELSKANEDDDPTKDLKINFIGLQYQGNLIFASPKDCVESNEKVITLNLEKNILSNNPLKYIFSSKEEYFETMPSYYINMAVEEGEELLYIDSFENQYKIIKLLKVT